MATFSTVWRLCWRRRDLGRSWASDVVRHGPRGGKPQRKDAIARAVELAPSAHKFEVFVQRWAGNGVYLKATVRVRAGKVTVTNTR